MAVRQYIGARYVPLYAGDWDETRNYEPLTIVTDANGNSFTSLKDVPAGTALTDRSYWIQTSSFSAAVDALQRRMSDAESDITTLSDDVTNISGEVQRLEQEIADVFSSDVIFITDSYGLDSAVPDGDSFITLLRASNPDARYLAIGGVGYGSDLYIADNFQSMLTAEAATMTEEERKKVKSIIVIGGANDGNLIGDGRLTESVLLSKITGFSSYVKTAFPNAVIKSCFVGWYRTNTVHAAYNRARDVYQSAAKECSNYSYVADGENIMRNNKNIETTNNIHPTAEASKELAAFAMCVALGGRYKYSKTETVDFTPANGVSSIQNLTLFESVYDENIASVSIVGEYANSFVRVRFSQAFALDFGIPFAIADLSGTPVGGRQIDAQMIFCAISTVSEIKNNVPFLIAVQNNQLAMKYVGGEDLTAFNMIMINIPTNTFLMNLRKS